MLRQNLLTKLKEKAKTQVEGRSSLYNPLLMKPKTMYPVGPGNNVDGLGGYAYIGPPPDFGGSYGAYEDEKGQKFVGAKSSKMYSAFTGQPIPMTAELSDAEKKVLLSQLEEHTEEHKCSACRSNLVMSIAKYAAEDIHCPHCGTKLEGAMEKVKQSVSKLQENDMEKVQEPKAAEVKPVAQAAPVAEGLKVPGNAGMPAAPAAAAPQPGVSDDGGMAAPTGQPAATAASADPEADKKAKEEKEAEAAKKKDDEAAEKAKEEKAEKEKAEAAVANKKRVSAMLTDYRARRAANKTTAKKDGAKESSMKKRFPVALSALKKDLRIMAACDPVKFAEVSKNPKLAKVCAEVKSKVLSKALRIKARAELKILASEDPEAHKEASEELEFVAPEILVEEDEGAPAAEGDEKPAAEAEAAAPAAEGDEKPAAEAGEEGGEAAEGEDDAMALEAMEFEQLANIDQLPMERVEMNLYQGDSPNPFWNLTVDAEPVARIYLADQDKAEDIRASFTSDAYAENLGSAIQQVGLKKLLKIVKAKLWAHKIDAKEVTARLRDSAKEAVKAELKKEFDEKRGTMRKDFLNAMALAMVAADKGLYSADLGSVALKGAFFNYLVGAGFESSKAKRVIEASFDEGSSQYFQSMMNHAVEIMDMSEETKQVFEKTALGASKQDVAAPEEDNLRDRLVQSSLNAVAMSGGAGGEDRKRSDIRTGLGFSARR